MTHPESLIARALLQASAVQAHMFAQMLRGEPASFPWPTHESGQVGDVQPDPDMCAEQRVRAWVSRRMQLFPEGDLVSELVSNSGKLRLTMSDLHAVLDTIRVQRALINTRGDVWPQD